MYNPAVTRLTANLASFMAPVDALGVLLAAPPRARADAGTAQDFSAQVRLVYRVALCGGSDALPERVDAKMHAKHCKELVASIAEYKKEWLDKAMPFIAKVRPAGLPPKVF